MVGYNSSRPNGLCDGEIAIDLYTTYCMSHMLHIYDMLWQMSMNVLLAPHITVLKVITENVGIQMAPLNVIVRLAFSSLKEYVKVQYTISQCTANDMTCGRHVADMHWCGSQTYSIYMIEFSDISQLCLQNETKHSLYIQLYKIRKQLANISTI